MPKMGPSDSLLAAPLKVLNIASRAVPAVDYALAAAGVAAAGALIMLFAGSSQAAGIVLAGVFVAMILLFVFAKVVASGDKVTVYAGRVLLWTVILFFCSFLFFTVTAFAMNWPTAMVRLLGIPQNSHKLKTGSIWDHNNSQVKLVIHGESIKFVYFKPEDKMIIAGAREGTVLFDGTIFAEEYWGIAWIFSKHCKNPVSYTVSGLRRADATILLRELVQSAIRKRAKCRAINRTRSHFLKLNRQKIDFLIQSETGSRDSRGTASRGNGSTPARSVRNRRMARAGV